MLQRPLDSRCEIAEIGKLVAEFLDSRSNARGTIGIGAHIAAHAAGTFLNGQSQNLAMHKVESF